MSIYCGCRVQEYGRETIWICEQHAALLAELASLREAHAQTERDFDAANDLIGQLREAHETHLKAVGGFLTQMWAVMIDPLEDGTGNVGEMCSQLLRSAEQQRQNDHDLREAHETLKQQLADADLTHASSEDIIERQGATLARVEAIDLSGVCDKFRFHQYEVGCTKCGLTRMHHLLKQALAPTSDPEEMT